jgi:hypothetical protein
MAYVEIEMHASVTDVQNDTADPGFVHFPTNARIIVDDSRRIAMQAMRGYAV